MLELNGCIFDPVTAQRAAVLDSAVQLSPAWPGNTTPSTGLACALYQFGMQDFTGPQTVLLGWSAPPAAADVTWVGLSDWEAGHWDWFQVQPGEVLLPPGGLAQYTHPTFASLLVAVIALGTEPCTLQFVRLGASLAGGWRMAGHDAQHTCRSEVVSAQTGEVKWELAGIILCGGGCSAVFDTDSTAYFCSQSAADENLFYLNAVRTDGSVKWQCSGIAGKPYALAVGHDGALYCGSSAGLYKVDRLGNILWRACPEQRFDLALVLDQEDTIYPGQSGTPGAQYCITPAGDTAWRVDTFAEGSVSAPVLLPSGRIMAFGLGGGISLDPLGNVFAQIEWNSAAHLGAAVGTDGTLYIPTSDCSNEDPSSPKISAISEVGGLYWQSNMPSAVQGGPGIGPDGTVYCSDQFGVLYAYSPMLTEKWHAIGGGANTLAIGVDGVVYTGGMDERLHAYKPNGEELWSVATDYETELHPSIADDGTLVVCGAGWVRAYGR